MTKSILVTGATGKQGGATLKALLQSNGDFQLIAVTRDANSASAQKLLGLSNKVKVVQGNLDNSTQLLLDAQKTAGQPIWGVFSVQVSMGPDQSVETEEKQGKALVDAAIAADVKHFVYSSIDRGVNGENDPTNIPHFTSKFNIEKHLASKTNGSDMTWTVLQPVAFLDNLGPAGSPFAPAFPTMWKVTCGEDKKLQLIAATDIGRMAAKALVAPEKYAGKKVGLAGDELTLNEARSIFKETVGQDLPEAPDAMAQGILSQSDDMHKMFLWFNTNGYAVDISKVKQELGQVIDFKAWLQQESGYLK
ncbi:NmrA-like family protein [Phyllosticta citrichinensis]|uniref:NmrA-like family protein n=1 Tax=Phyllosticta citrichinensis TaxID=1130410 RepID=A0ABR1XLR8_9PEZI